MKRAFVGGIVAGIVLFVWGFVAHDVLPLGSAGVRTIPPAQEEAVMAVLRGSMNERALYLFPGMDRSGKMTAEEQKAWTAKYAAGPAGVIAFNPHPADPASAATLFPKVFATEFVCDVLAALLAALLVSQLPASLAFGKRVMLVGSLGLLMTLDVDVSYWNWYGFPTAYTLAQLVDHGVGWSLAGLVLARR